MSTVYTKQFGRATTTAVATYVTLGTVPTGKVWVVRNLIAVVLGANQTELRVAASTGGTDVLLVKQRLIPPGGFTFALETRAVLEAATVLKFQIVAVGGLSDNITCWVTGYEFDA